MKPILSGIFAAALALSASAVQAQDKPPLKIGGILDMSSLYADITGPGSETAAKMAVEDFGGEVLGRKIQVLAADHLNKADLSASIARDMLDNQGVEMSCDVTASATALAAGEIAKARGKIIMFNGPGSIRLSNEACGPTTVHYVFDTFAQANVTGLAAVKSGLDTWFFLTADYAFGQDLEKDTSNVVVKTGGKVLGNDRHPLNTSDSSSFLLQAQAGVYASVAHYLQSVKAAGTTDSAAVMKIMKETPINDFFAKNGKIREDGRMIHDMYLFEVKKPSESRGRWDDYKLLATVPGNEAFQSLEASRCPLVKK